MKRAFLAAVLAALSVSALAQPAKLMDASSFRQAAISSETFELEASRLALQRATSSRGRRFAERMIQDHSMITAALSANPGAPGTAAAASRAAALAPPATEGSAGPVTGPTGVMQPRHAAMLQQLSAAHGRAFERLFKRMQIQVHREAIALYTAYSRDGNEPALAKLARKALSHLRTHLEDAEEM